MTVHDDAMAFLEAENKILYDQVETVEAAIRWCIVASAYVEFTPSYVRITLYRLMQQERTWQGETFLDVIDDIKKELAEEGEQPYASEH